MYIYAMSDIHACLYEFEQALSLVDLSGDNKLVLLGDYIHGGPDGYCVLDKIMELQRQYGNDKVIALLGNHDDWILKGTAPINEFWIDGVYDNDNANDDKYIAWLQTLPMYYSEGNTIFVHAGVDEALEADWEWSDDFSFIEKYPAQTGKFYMNIVAGHVGSAVVANDPSFHDIFYDGESHYYIDGTVLDSGVIPVIKVDVEKDKYYRVTENGDWLILPYNDEN